MSLQLKYWLLPALIILLGLISIVTLKSVANQFATLQLIFLLISLSFFLIISRFSFSSLLRFRWWGYAGVVLLLLATLVIGSVTRNTRRWISIGGFFSIQGSQFATPIVGLSLAHFIAQREREQDSFKPITIFQLLVLMGIPAALILIAPDLGSAVFFLGSLASLVMLGPIPLRYLALLGGLSVAASIFAWQFILQPYQKDRVYCFAAPQLSKTCSTYNAEQSLIAVGSGQLFGRGLGQGVQSHLQFLPERQTDFIFASFAEEWGFLGSVLLICLYVVLVGYVVILGIRAEHRAEYYYCMIIATMITLQSAYHIGMNMYLFPIKGISLPFVSYGGSSMLGMTMGLAFCQTISQVQTSKLGQHFG